MYIYVEREKEGQIHKREDLVSYNCMNHVIVLMCVYVPTTVLTIHNTGIERLLLCCRNNKNRFIRNEFIVHVGVVHLIRSDVNPSCSNIAPFIQIRRLCGCVFIQNMWRTSYEISTRIWVGPTRVSGNDVHWRCIFIEVRSTFLAGDS